MNMYEQCDGMNCNFRYYKELEILLICSRLMENFTKYYWWYREYLIKLGASGCFHKGKTKKRCQSKIDKSIWMIFEIFEKKLSKIS